MDFPHIPADASPQQRFAIAADYIRALTGADRVLVIAQDETRMTGLVSSGFSDHASVNAALAMGIHLNCKDHDRKAASGAFGDDAAALLETDPTIN